MEFLSLPTNANKGRPGEAGLCIVPLKQRCVPINKRAKTRSKPKRNPPFYVIKVSMGKAGSALSDISLRTARYCHDLFWFISDTMGLRSTRPTKSITYSKAGSALSDIPLRTARHCHDLFLFISDTIGLCSTRPTKSITYSKAGSALSDISLRTARYCHNLFWFIDDTIGLRSTRPTKS